ncbi:MAG: extracellular solute-binding protein [bacterium]|nr:extracellular solute-binding protein [bacterium]
MLKKLKKSHLIIFSLFFIFILGGLGCKGLSQEEQAAVKPVTLNYWTIYNDVNTLRSFAESYKVAHPYVNIKVRQIRYEEFDNLFANALADDVAPDIVSMSPRWINRYLGRLDPMPEGVKVANIYTEGKFQPKTVVTIENNMMPSLDYIRKSYVTTVVDDIIIGGRVYGLPLFMDTLAMYYNVELLDKAGVPVPPKTWDEFSSAVKKSTKYDRDGNIIQSGVALGTGENVENSFDIISLLMMQNRITMAQGTKVTFTSGLSDREPGHPVLATMQFYTDFARPTKDVYSWNAKMANSLDEFARGKSIFYFGFAYDAPRLKARGPQIKYNIVPVPQLSAADPANVANYWIESVVAKSEHKDEAWDFIRYITMPERVLKYVEKTGQPSPLREQLVTQQEDPVVGPFALQAITAKNWYRGKDIIAADQAFNDLFTNYLMPVGEGEGELKRNIGFIGNASRIIQQTM